jgi:16S rRNA A1518/A1519 N6-dimethyltransferase RsmA/KsgA/DIM1 with predicted DNA glycosylase/AP lyase activity
MVVTLTVLLKSLKTLTISSNIPYEIGDTLTLELSNTTYFFEVI